ncbi:hypothetical protein VPHD81_0094 [Vibrio phage D81]
MIFIRGGVVKLNKIPPPPKAPPGVRHVKDGCPNSAGFNQFCAGIVCGFVIGVFVMVVMFMGVRCG